MERFFLFKLIPQRFAIGNDLISVLFAFIILLLGYAFWAKGASFRKVEILYYKAVIDWSKEPQELFGIWEMSESQVHRPWNLNYQFWETASKALYRRSFCSVMRTTFMLGKSAYISKAFPFVITFFPH